MRARARAREGATEQGVTDVDAEAEIAIEGQMKIEAAEHRWSEAY